MSALSESLCASSRGRRLLLAFALASEARREESQVATELPLWKAVFDTQVASTDAVDARGWGAEHIPRATDAATLARLLDRVVLVRVTPELVAQVEASLDAPHRLRDRASGGPASGGTRVDGLLESPLLEAPLARIARHVSHKRIGRELAERLGALAQGQGAGMGPRSGQPRQR